MSSVVKRGLGDIGTDAQLLVAKWLDLRSLCRLERVSKSMRLIARHKSLWAKLRRLTLCPSDYSDTCPETISTNLPLLGTILIGGEDLDELYDQDGESCEDEDGGSKDEVEEEAKHEVKADEDDGEREGKDADKEPKKAADPMEIVLGYKAMEDFFPALVHHVLERGAGLTSLEILGTEKKMGRFWYVDEVLGSIQHILKKKNVKLTSFAMTHVACYALKPVGANFLAAQAGTLETLVLGPVQGIDPGAMGAKEMLKELRNPKLKALKHLFLSVGDGEGLGKWLGPLSGQLELFVAQVGDGSAEDWAEDLAAVAKKAGSTLECQEEPYRVVLASAGLNESALGKGELHSVDFLKDGSSLTAEARAEADSDDSFDPTKGFDLSHLGGDYANYDHGHFDDYY